MEQDSPAHTAEATEGSELTANAAGLTANAEESTPADVQPEDAAQPVTATPAVGGSNAQQVQGNGAASLDEALSAAGLERVETRVEATATAYDAPPQRLGRPRKRVQAVQDEPLQKIETR